MAELPTALQESLTGRYRLERVIGQGGMATVYLALDVKHGRQVAVKVLRPDLSATIGAERFLREIQIAARLQHPHILLLIDSGEAAGLLYYVMPFVAGESLRARLERRGTLSPEETVDLVRQVAGALEYAHRHGVVHRDIKPENILLADGHAIVADFGVAKAVSEAADRSITRTGHPVGTIGYMSPEQAAGFAELDARSDVFSLGCVAYEALIGRVPGFWPSDEAQRLRRLVDAPAEHRARLDRLPGSVEQVLVQSLAIRPELRFATPMALADALAVAIGEKPRYTDREVRTIVQRAAEIEATAPTQSGALSLGGIQQLAADVGIPPEHVASAAAELSGMIGSPPAPTANPFLGSPTRVVVERIVPGEVSENDYPVMVEQVRMTIGNVGQASTLGRSLAWNTIGPQGQTRTVSLSVSPMVGQTRIRLEENLGQLAGGLFGGLMGGLGAGAGIPLSFGLAVGALHLPILVPVFLVATVGGSFGLARWGLRAMHGKRRRELEELADRLARFAEKAALERPGSGRRALR